MMDVGDIVPYLTILRCNPDNSFTFTFTGSAVSAIIGEDLTGQSVGMSLALALIGRHLDLPREAPMTLYGLGRSSGWLAHAIEQMQTGASPKARLRYIGIHPEATEPVDA